MGSYQKNTNKQNKKAIQKELIIKALETKTQPERDSLIAFMKSFFKQEKNREFTSNWHYELLADKLKWVVDWKIRRLIINLPPRHWKTELITKCFPVWALWNNPSLEIIATSYSATLAQEFSSEARDYYTSKTFQSIFPRADNIKDSQNTKDYWKLQSGWSYYATGSGGSITGRWANCLVWDTLVSTDKWKIKIEELAINNKKVNILSYNHTLSKLEYKKCLAYQISDNDNIYEITTSSWIKIKWTWEHKFFILWQWYKEAKSLQKWDKIIKEEQALWELLKNKMMKMIIMQILLFWEKKSSHPSTLLKLYKRINKTSLWNKKSFKKKSKIYVLFLKMFRTTLYGEILNSLQELWLNKNWQNKEILFWKMQNWLQDEEQKITANKLSRVWDKSKSNISFDKILLNEMQKFTSFKNNVIKKQSKLQTLTFKKKLSLYLLQTKKKYIKKRLKQMYSMFFWKDSMYTSQRSQSIKQSSSEFNNSMQTLSYNSSQIKTDTISDIKIIKWKTKVYDIEVEDNNNFFANNILVHNCFIIDDPIKPDETESEIKRIWINNWYNNTVISRLNNPKQDSIIIIMQRLHDDDLCWFLKEKMDDWTWDDWDIVNLPAIAEEDEEHILSDWKILKRKEWEPLFEARFDLDVLNQIKKWIWDVIFSCQYQQDPIAKENQEFHEEWFKYYNWTPSEFWRIFTSCDPAFSKSKRADFSVVTTAKFIWDKMYILEQSVWKRNPAELEDILVMHVKKWTPEKLWIEAVQAQTTVAFSLKARLRREKIIKTEIVEIRQKWDKPQKIRALIPLYRNWLIYHKEDMRGEVLEGQLLKFPRWKKDDCPDWMQMLLYLYELQPNVWKRYKMPVVKYNSFWMPVITKNFTNIKKPIR